MPIQEQNIVFVESQVMDDVPEGGGAATGRVVVSGQMNNVFPDIADLDRTTGRFRLRKLFLAIRSLSTDLYGGARIAITALPTDTALGYTIFSTSDPFDTRAQAADRVASYLFAASEWPGYLLENHRAGQKSIEIIQRLDAPLPAIGRTLVLVHNEGLPNQVQQYVCVIGVSSEVRTYSYSASGGYVDYQAAVVMCELSDALRYDFPGSPPARNFARVASKTLIRDTRVADAAQYYGAARLAAAAGIGDRRLRVDSVYSQLVPSLQAEQPLIDETHAMAFSHVLATTPREVVVGGSPMSLRIKIGQENRGYNYTAILKPLPAPGSVRVVYRALGNTYTLADNGAGGLEGAGSGTINPLTGSALATLHALPDAGSAVVFYWGPNAAYTNRSGQAGFRAPMVRFALDHRHIDPASLSISWPSGGVVKTATDDGRGGWAGDGTGAIVYATGEAFLAPSVMPDAGAQYAIEYTWSPKVEEAKPGLTPDVGGFVSFTVAEPPVPGSLELSWAVSQQTSVSSGSNAAAASSVRNAAAAAIPPLSPYNHVTEQYRPD